jgi:hypothetical protein
MSVCLVFGATRSRCVERAGTGAVHFHRGPITAIAVGTTVDKCNLDVNVDAL